MTTTTDTWATLCEKSDLVEHSGVTALYNGEQVALFYIPGYDKEVFAIGNHDPFSGANVLAHGLVGDLKGELMVASPLYKQHFSLKSGQCFEDNQVKLPVWSVRFEGDQVVIQA